MLNKLNKKKEDGFTIIEVLIVLAIAGLILVVVLIAIPQLQRNQRNTARQNDASRVASSVSNWVANNNGGVPTSSDVGDIVDDIGELSQYTISTSGVLTITAKGATDESVTNLTNIQIVTAARCNGGVANAGAPRQFVVLYATETSSTTPNPACVDV